MLRATFVVVVGILSLLLVGAAANDPLIEAMDGNLNIHVDSGKQVFFDSPSVYVNGSAVITDVTLRQALLNLRAEMVSYFVGPDVTVQVSLTQAGVNTILGQGSLLAPRTFMLMPIEQYVAQQLGALSSCLPSGANTGVNVTATVSSPSGSVSTMLTTIFPQPSDCMTLATALTAVTNNLYPTLAPPTGGLFARFAAAQQTISSSVSTATAAAVSSASVVLGAAIEQTSSSLSQSIVSAATVQAGTTATVQQSLSLAVVGATTQLSTSITSTSSQLSSSLLTTSTQLSTAIASSSSSLATSIGGVAMSVQSVSAAVATSTTQLSSAVTTVTSQLSTSIASAATSLATSINNNAAAQTNATATLNASLIAQIGTVSSAVANNVLWRTEFNAVTYGPETVFNVLVVGTSNSAVVYNASFVGPTNFGSVSTMQFIYNQLNLASICQGPVTYLLTVSGQGYNVSGILTTIPTNFVCQSLSVAVPALPCFNTWPTTQPATGGIAGRIYAAIQSASATVNTSWSMAIAAVASTQASAASASATISQALSGQISTLQSRATNAESGLSTLSNSLASQIATVYVNLGLQTNITNTQINTIATDLNLTKVLSNTLNILNNYTLFCHDKGLVYSRSQGTCKVPISVLCAEAGPSLGGAYIPQTGTCRSSNVFGAPSPCIITCNTGYTGSSTATYTCGADGLWSGGPAPTCTPVSCGAVSLSALGINAATVTTVCTTPGTKYGDNCNVTCASGYTGGSIMTSMLTCTAAGTWSGTITCTALNCGMLSGDPVTNRLSAPCTNTKFGNTCALTCNSPTYGLTITNLATYTCSASGTWTTSNNLLCMPNPQSAPIVIVYFVNGCPGPLAANTNWFFKSISVPTTTYYWIVSTQIRNVNGRADMWILVNGVNVAEALPYTSIQTWLSTRVFFSGTMTSDVATTFAVQSTPADLWGCQNQPYGGFFMLTVVAQASIRFFNTFDNRGGCPPTATAGTTLLSLSFTTIAANSIVLARAHMIRQIAGRSDLNFLLDSSQVDISLSYTATSQWEDMSVYYLGTISAVGTHGFTLTGTTDTTFGCGPTWGGMDLMVIDDPRIVKWWRVTDQVSGCPSTSRPAGVLLTFTYTQVSTSATMWISGHMIRNVAGRADLYLIIDGTVVNRFISYTDTAQWYDAHVYFSGNLGPGTHTISMNSDVANIWGCGPTWGTLNAVVVGEPSS